MLTYKPIASNRYRTNRNRYWTYLLAIELWSRYSALEPLLNEYTWHGMVTVESSVRAVAVQFEAW